MSPAPVSASPISDSLQKHLNEVLTQIPTGKTGTVTVGIATTGAVVSASARKTWRGLDLTGTGYAGKVWGSKGWEAGARAGITF